ncbi:MAG TPA: thioredoxin family protein [Acidobacteriaceae bacterium]|jgi:predicted dithiol-disulfide oxidoreductase (DUF899 family)|nr:thioredoxin family protein [Acidobacteriaceae bacterium]
MATMTAEVKQHKVVSQQEWLAARKEFLAKEKEFTRLRDELSRQRRELPWEKVEKAYTFDSPRGKVPFADLFANRSQLILYHFMLGPGWVEGCKSCSYLADHFDGTTIHLAHRDTTLAVVAHAPMAEIAAFKQRMGWRFPWYSSFASDFNFDYHVSFTAEELAAGEIEYNYRKTGAPSQELPGLSVFYKDEAGEIFRTYSTYARGLDIFVGTYNFLDATPKGRDEEGMVHTMAWVRHHDKYQDGYAVDPTAGWEHPKVGQSTCCSGGKH